MGFNIGTVNDKKAKLGITRDLLVHLYWVESQSTGDIACTFDTTRATVARWLKYHNVPTRQSKNFAHISPAYRKLVKLGHISYEGCDVALTPLQRSFLIGTLCGDGCLKKTSDRTGTGYYAGHHGPKQAAYLLHKAELMQPLTSRVHTNPDGDVETATVSTLELGQLHDRLYNGKGSKKFLDRWVFEDLDERGLVYWYLDDGSFSQMHYTINCYSSVVYNWEDVQKLLTRKFGIPFAIHNSYTNGMKSIYVPTDGAGLFTELMLQYAHPSMLWKAHPWYMSVLSDNQQPSLEGNLSEGSTTEESLTSFEYGGNSCLSKVTYFGMPDTQNMGGDTV